MNTILTALALSILGGGIIITLIVIFVLLCSKRYEMPLEGNEPKEASDWINEEALVGPIPSDYDELSNRCATCSCDKRCKL